MNVQGHILPKLKALVEHPGKSVSEEDLDNEDVIEALELLDRIGDALDTLPGDSGSQILVDYRTFISKIASSGLSHHPIFEKSTDILFLLMIANSIPFDTWLEEVDSTFFGMKLTEIDPQDNLMETESQRILFFANYSSQFPKNSIAYIDFKNLKPKIFSELDEHEINGVGAQANYNFKAIICILLLNYSGMINDKSFIIATASQKNILINFLKFQIVANGFLLFNPIHTGEVAGMDEISNFIKPVRRTSQFLEPLEMLSEINTHTTVINKFLAAYHSLENYMLRARIAKAENSRTDDFFRINDLRFLSQMTDDVEAKYLQMLFDSLWNLEIAGQPLVNFATDCTNNLTNSDGFSQADFEQWMKKSGAVTKKVEPLTIGTKSDMIQNFSKIVYKFRCSVVHAKATEFHISNSDLENPTLNSIFGKLLIPVLCRVAFGLPTVTKDNPISYKNQHLQLYPS